MHNRIKSAALAWWKGWSYYECGSLSAATAYYAALSSVPLMLVVMAAIGSFFELADRGPGAEERLLEFVSIQISPKFSEALGKLLSDLGEHAVISGPVAGLGLVVSASLVFAQIDRGFERIWDVRNRERRRGALVAAKRVAAGRLRSLMLVGLASVTVLFVFVVGMVIRGAMDVVREYLPQVTMISRLGTLLLGFLVNALNLAMIYRILSKERVRLLLCLKVGIFAAAIWELGSQMLIAVSFGERYGVYGQVGSILVVLVWVHFTAMVLFAGAIIVRNASVTRAVPDSL